MTKEYVFKNGFKVLVPEDMTQQKMIEEWATVAMYMSIMLHPPPNVKKDRKAYTWKQEATKNKRGWKAPKPNPNPKLKPE